jgi:hypothetical protein
MPQKTNLNISPYYDDFDKDKNFYRVLFKPGYPVQARELTTLQSILQNQVESFGSHIFKEGSMVIPGNINYDPAYYSVRLNADHLGIDLSVYVDKLVGKRLTGQTSGIVAIVDKYLEKSVSEGITDLTLFVKYLQSGDDNEIAQFSDGEILITEESFTYGNTTVNAGDTVATLVSEDATAVGTSVGIGAGVYFIRGTFVDIAQDKLVLDAYTNNSSYRVGLNILEEIVTAKDDNTLYDNAKGFSNYAAPGADRLKISATLTKKLLNDFNDKTFIELIRIENGEIKKLQNKTQYNYIRDYFAQRTYDESGDYSVNQFGIEVKESLNDRQSNDGIYFPGQTTQQQATPSEDLMEVVVSPGKAYVRGYDIDSTQTTILDVEKPRDKESVSSALIPFEFGTLMRVNNVSGTPFIGIDNNTNIVDLYSQRKNSTTAGTGTLIGKGRVYSFNLTDASYSDPSTEWDLYLFDVQTYTVLTVNESLSSVTCPETSFVRGVSSGATGYAAENPSGTTLTLTQTSGTFIAGEQLVINETTEVSRSVVSVTTYGIEDVKSVYQDSTTLTSELKVDFVADTVLQKSLPKNFSLTDRLTITSGGTATCPGRNFAGTGIKENSIIRYQISGLSTETYNRVSSVSSDGLTLTLVALNDVYGVCDGDLPGSTQSVTFSVGNPLVRDNGGLYAKISSDNVASVDLADSTLLVNSQITEQSTNSVGSVTINVNATGITSAFFEAFDEERYSVFYSDGSIENLTSDQFTSSSNGSQITLSGLTPSQSSNITINTTVRKNGVKEKQKDYVRSEKVTINKTVSGVSTSLSGLTTSVYYGTRVQDKEICLNLPDVVKVLAVYESYNSSAPTLDSLEFPSGLSLNTASILGEKIIGQDSGALAQIVTRSSATVVEIVYLNSNKFTVGEIAEFQESNIKSTIQTVNIGNYQNVTNQYTLDKGQREQYYDYSRLVRKSDSYIPTYQLLAIFDYYDVPSNDLGDVYTVNSYDAERFKSDIPYLPSGVRSSDTLDFRPRVARFTSITSSPFAFGSRTFGTTGTNPPLVVTPLESSLIGYEYYLSRIDKVVLDKLGNFSVIKGISALNPKVPTNVEEAMDLATIELPAYLYNTKDAKITLVDNRRYTMRDIGKIEDRVETLETLTSLSLLELDTKTLQVRDADGLDRFKSGFFVDDFRDNQRLDSSVSTVAIDLEDNELITSTDAFSLKPEIALDPSINTDTADFSANLQLLDSNVQKTGNLITLKYTQKGWIEQPLASRVENVNPFNMIDFKGSIKLFPSSDSWVRTITIDGGSRRYFGGTTGRYSESSWTEIVKISSEPEVYIRSRNVKFESFSLKPLTRYYPFFDGSSGIDIIPKLIEVTMTSGTFEVGETVRGFVGSENIFTAKVAQPNHKTGNLSSPTTTYSLNPYNKSVTLPASYSASSSVLNIDVNSLSEEVLGKYSGYITVGTVLVGETSGAQASVSNIRLISDTFGDTFGCFFFRNPLTTPPPIVRFTTGTSTFKLTSSSTDATPLPGSLLISSAETTYRTSGILEVYEETRITVFYDPLAQSFTVDETGAFLTSVDVFFANKDENEKLTAQIRTVELGTPTRELVDENAQVVLEPSQINVSSDASVPTRITFPAPIYLSPDTEYALVLLAPSSNQYEVWIARMGEKTINTSTLPDAESVVVGKQYTGGSLFKSQNGSIWTANQFEDMKFKLYKANFITNKNNPAVAYFYNPSLVSNDSNIGTLTENPIRTLPRKLKVGITTTTTMNSVLVVGRKVSDTTTGAPTGYIERVGGAVTSFTTSRVGAGYSNGTFTNVPFYSITGSGSGATGIVTFASGQVTGNPAILSSGNGYVVGDIVGITTSNVVKGTGAQISVTTLRGFDTLYLTNVQGEEFTSGQDLVVYNGNTAVSYGNTDILSSSQIGSLYDGRVIEVTQYSHGMHADNNVITISNVEPNTIPTTLNAAIGLSDTTISVANTSIFGTFEGITTSRGYLKVNNEIIYYNSITAGGSGAGTLGIGTRGVDGSLKRTHNIGDKIYKYELNGVSLTKINTQHNMPSDATLSSMKDLDKYYLQIDRSGRSTGDSQLSFTDENYLGGSNVFASKNIQYNAINPSFTVFTPGEDTTISASVRTVSGTSADGAEVSFIDQGYESVEINNLNELSSTRLVASRINETTRLTTLPKNKSLTIGLSMTSGDPNLSPTINVDKTTVDFIRNRINRPIGDYAFDGRSNLASGTDPHAAVYLTNRVDLKQPATSLKVLVGGYRHSSADFRVLYQLFRADSSEVEQAFELFPGYDNLKDTNGDGFGDTIIDSTRNSGRPDAFVPASQDDEFREYQFSIDNLNQFTGFRIKIVMNGTNEAYAPRLKDLRVIALA